jgi:hypothetical protein
MPGRHEAILWSKLSSLTRLLVNGAQTLAFYPWKIGLFCLALHRFILSDSGAPCARHEPA